MSLQDIINNSKFPITKDYLVNAFKDLGIKNNDTIMVHSSVSSFGYVVNGAHDIIDALIETVTDGIIIIPGHTTVNSTVEDWQRPPVPSEWHETLKNNIRPTTSETEPNGIGAVPRVFSRYDGVYRTNHPYVSLLYFGKVIPEQLKNHHLDKPHSMHGPFGYLYENNVKLLMLGSEYDNLTFMHLACNLNNGPYQVIESNIYEDNKIKRVSFEFEDDDTDLFNTIGSEFEVEKQEYITIKKIGNSTCKLINGKELVDYTLEYYNKHSN